MTKYYYFILLFIVWTFACSDSTPSSDLIASRPYGLAVPKAYNGSPTPLIVTLHGLGESGLLQAQESGLLAMVDTHNFILAYPDGTMIIPGERGWNASCCDPTLPVDDVAYLRAVIGDVSQHYKVDPKRVYVTGYSNGAFMAHLFACEAADLVAAISVYAGTMISGEETKCLPKSPVSVMDAHGNSDTSVDFNGGTLNFGLGNVNYISAPDVVQTWVTLDSCSLVPTMSSFDVDAGIAGSETTISHYGSCKGGRTVELWEISGGTHIPNLTDAYKTAVIDFFYSNSKI